MYPNQTSSLPSSTLLRALATSVSSPSPTATLSANATAANSPQWTGPVVLGIILAVAAVVVGVPSAILALAALRTSDSGIGVDGGDVENGVVGLEEVA